MYIFKSTFSVRMLFWINNPTLHIMDLRKAYSGHKNEIVKACHYAINL